MRVKIREAGTGLHPNEIKAIIRTTEGEAVVYLHRRSVSNDSVDIGYPIVEREGSYLIELPRETSSGSWRIWVPVGDVIEADKNERAVA